MVDERVAAEEEEGRTAPDGAAGSDEERPSLRDFESGNPHMCKLLRRARPVVYKSIPILIQGETGSGKNRLAEAIHNDGVRAGKPFVIFPSRAVPPGLEESMLFGHVRDAFTGATCERRGLLEQADWGTLLLEEAGEYSPEFQATLLRLLDSRQYYRVGDDQELTSNARIIAATNRNLKAEVAEGRFRPDLYYRLAKWRIDVPPLRSHPDDVERLAYRFLKEIRHTEDGTAERIHHEVFDALQGYPWPGNVRELYNVIWCALDDCPGAEIRLEHLPDDFREDLSRTRPSAAPPRDSAVHVAPFVPAPPSNGNGRAVPSMDDLVKQAERHGIERALRVFGGNVTLAAKALNRSRKWVALRMRRYGLRREDFVNGNGKVESEPP